MANFKDLNFSVVIGHGPGCRDGSASMWIVWRNLPEEYKHQLSLEGGFYASPRSYEDESTSESKLYSKPHSAEEPASSESKLYLHPNSQEGAMRLQENGYPLVFVFTKHHEKIDPRLITGKRVLILDLDLGDALVEVVKLASYVFVCDHHVSTSETIKRHSEFLLCHNRHKFSTYINTSKYESGASLTWKLYSRDPVPPLVRIVQMGDTWTWNSNPHLEARAVLKALFVKRSFRSFADLEETFRTWDTKFESYVDTGKLLLSYETSLVRKTAKKCNIGYIQTSDGTWYTVAYIQSNLLHSEIGASMRWFAEKRFGIPIHFCVTWNYVSYNKLVSVSLRDPVHHLNLSEIAQSIPKTFGRGGGHLDAASFMFEGLENFHKFIRPTPE